MGEPGVHNRRPEKIKHSKAFGTGKGKPVLKESWVKEMVKKNDLYHFSVLDASVQLASSTLNWWGMSDEGQ